jgi:hypothetical protein
LTLFANAKRCQEIDFCPSDLYVVPEMQILEKGYVSERFREDTFCVDLNPGAFHLQLAFQHLLKTIYFSEMSDVKWSRWAVVAV